MTTGGLGDSPKIKRADGKTECRLPSALFEICIRPDECDTCHRARWVFLHLDFVAVSEGTDSFFDRIVVKKLNLALQQGISFFDATKKFPQALREFFRRL